MYVERSLVNHIFRVSQSSLTLELIIGSVTALWTLMPLVGRLSIHRNYLKAGSYPLFNAPNGDFVYFCRRYGSYKKRALSLCTVVFYRPSFRRASATPSCSAATTNTGKKSRISWEKIVELACFTGNVEEKLRAFLTFRGATAGGGAPEFG